MITLHSLYVLRRNFFTNPKLNLALENYVGGFGLRSVDPPTWPAAKMALITEDKISRLLCLEPAPASPGCCPCCSCNCCNSWLKSCKSRIKWLIWCMQDSHLGVAKPSREAIESLVADNSACDFNASYLLAVRTMQSMFKSRHFRLDNMLPVQSC